MNDYLVCFKKDRQGTVMLIKRAVLLSHTNTTEVSTKENTQRSVSLEDLSGVLSEFSKNLNTQVASMVEERLAQLTKKLSITHVSSSANARPNPSTDPSASHTPPVNRP